MGDAVLRLILLSLIINEYCLAENGSDSEKQHHLGQSFNAQNLNVLNIISPIFNSREFKLFESCNHF